MDVKKISLCLLFLSSKLFALEGAITVLEAPIFNKPDATTKVIQYARKGDLIYIHPQEAAKNNFNRRQPPLEITSETTQKYDELYEDPLFQKPSDTYLAKDENPSFYRTMDKRGRIAYILKEHVHVYYEDEREFTQVDIKPDPTDYRIQEPLPPDYPFISEIGYKGYLGIGVGKPSDSFYPAGTLDDSTTNPSFQLWGNWSKQIEFDQDRRLYWGWMGVYEAYTNTYLVGQTKTKEQTMRFAVGPQINYDLWRRPKHILNIAGTILFNLYFTKDNSNENTVTKEVEKESFKSYFFTPTITLSYQRVDIGPNMDFVIGSNILVDLPHRMRSNDDDYSQGFSLNFGLFIAGQTSY